MLADHARYDVQLLYIGPDQPGGFDVYVPSIDAAQQYVRSVAPAVLIPNYVWDLYLAGFESGIACVGMCHADDEEQYYRPLGWCEPMIAKFIAVSRECGERLAERLPHRAGDIATLPYGVSIPRPLERSDQTKKIRLIYAGRVTQLQKRVWDFIPLLQHLVAANVDFEFEIVGDGDALSALKDEVLDKIPAGRVRFRSRIPHSEMREVWLGNDVFLQVSDFEGTSVSMLEAMAHGVTPVVTAASSGIAGVIHDGENGFVVPIGDMTSMTGAITKLADDRQLLSRIGRAAYESVQPYAMELYAERFAAFLDQLTPEGQQVDLYQRYGMFGHAHPMFKLRQLFVHQQEQIAQMRQGAIRRMLKNGYRSLARSKHENGVHK